MRITLKRLILFASIGVIIVFCANYLFRQASAQKTRRFEEFSHSVKEHKKSCSSCHKVPSRNWRSAAGYPNVTDYPDHDSCVGCHRQQFFAGNHPEICTVCHVQASPRGKARLRFPMRGGGQEFRTNFPHGLHQDIIAANPNERVLRTSHNVLAAYVVNYIDDDKKPTFNSCAICHRTTSTLPAFTERKPLNTEPLSPPGAETFTAQSEYFKDSPDSHASCFSCHYQGQEPVASNCAGCHVLSPAYSKSNVISRYSLKFNHEDEDHNNKDCTLCHIRITQSAEIQSLIGADVPILTCSTSSCHQKDVRSEISKRRSSVAKSEPVFQCNYCHTAAVGSFKTPASHLK